MRKMMLAGAVALVLVGSSAAFAGDGLVITSGHVAHFTSVLNLRLDKERYWAPVAATVRDIARRQGGESATLDGASLRRLVSAAMPLFRRLDTDQKREAMRLARSLGISSLASLF